MNFNIRFKAEYKAQYIMIENYLESVNSQFKYYKLMGEKAFAQISDEAFFKTVDKEGNSIAIIVKHLHGNMLSRWTDFLESDGEKTWRNRDGEFEKDTFSRADYLEKWEEGWNCLFTALNTITEDDFDRLIYIRNMGHTIVEAINRQLAHYAYHVGQIVFQAKMIQGAKWKSLSIQKGNSASYNQQQFQNEKKRGDFAKKYIKQDKNKDVT